MHKDIENIKDFIIMFTLYSLLTN